MPFSILDYNNALTQNNAGQGALAFNTLRNAKAPQAAFDAFAGNYKGAQDVAPKGDVLGAPTGGTSRQSELEAIGGNRNPAQESEYQALMRQLQASAQSGQQATLDAIQRRLNETRNLAKQKIENATGTRDYLVDFINKRYPELQQRVEQQRANTLEDLSGQETDLTNLYDRANAQARRRSESAALKNRMIARAGNRLGSSFYDELVAENQEGLGRQLGESDLEKIGKLAAIGTQKTRSNQEFDNTINDLDTQKNQATYAAIDEYKKAVQEGEALERAGVLDFGESEAMAAQNLQSRLDSIAQWAQGMASQKLALDAQYGRGGSFDTGLDSMASQVGTFLQGNAQTPAGNNLQAYAPTISGGTQQAGGPNLYANQGVRGTDDILRQLGLA